MDKEFPFERDIMSQNTRCEIAEGVAFDKRLSSLNMDEKDLVNNLIHDYIKWVFGEPTKD